LDDQRKKIIVAEIENWRKNHLLPEHYCIFLLNLYTEGDPPAEKKENKGFFGASGGGSGTGYRYLEGGASVVSWKMIAAWFIGACLIAGTILLAFHFNDFSTSMQIAIWLGFVLFFYALSMGVRRFVPALTHVALAISFLLLALGGLHFLGKLGLGPSFQLLFLAVICLLWCLNGLMLGYTYLLYCGMIGFGLLYGISTVQRIALDYSWWKGELYWVPISLLMIGLGFLLDQRNSTLAGVFAVCGMIFFFGAEIQALYIPEAKHDLIQLLLFIKVFLSSALFFFSRKYWFSWLRL
jgi:hypothetical protein